LTLQESFRQLYREGGLEDNTITIDVPPNTSGAGGIVGSDGPMGGTVSGSLHELQWRTAVRASHGCAIGCPHRRPAAACF
jgi:hypothetical protein